MNVNKELRNLLAKQQKEEYFHISLEEEFAFYRDIASGNPDILQGDIANQNWEHMGTLSANPLQNMKYHHVILIAMITRFCIEGGLEPEQSFTLSDLLLSLLLPTPCMSFVKGKPFPIMSGMALITLSNICPTLFPAGKLQQHWDFTRNIYRSFSKKKQDIPCNSISCIKNVKPPAIC